MVVRHSMAWGTAGNEIGRWVAPIQGLCVASGGGRTGVRLACCSFERAIAQAPLAAALRVSRRRVTRRRPLEPGAASITALMLNRANGGSDARQPSTFAPFIYINTPACMQAQTLGALSLLEDALIFRVSAT